MTTDDVILNAGRLENQSMNSPMNAPIVIFAFSEAEMTFLVAQLRKIAPAVSTA